jgi:glycosyltransferase involved in cell wall biosynthesis
MRGTVLFVANFPANTGYAWDFIEGLFAGIAARLAPGVRAFVAYPENAAPPRPLSGAPAEPVKLDARLETAASRRQTIAFARRERVDVVYLVDRPARSAFYPLLRAAGVRGVVVHDHTSGAGTVPRGIKRWGKWSLARVPGFTADRVIAVSDFVARRQRDVGMIPATRVTRVWNSVRIPPRSDGTTEARRALGIEGTARVVACTCRATSEKGVDHLFRAFDRLAPSPDTLLLYAGNGPAFASLEELRATLASRDRIRLLGYRSDRELLLDAADVCVVPSVWQEAFGLAALEAMARGKPVVATTVGGIPEIIRPGVTGLLVPPADEEQLASALATLLSQPADAQRIGAAARADVEARFAPEQQIEQLTALVAEHLP